jgi:hypothetical protein
VFGGQMVLRRRAKKMLSFYRTNAGFETEEKWLARWMADLKIDS